METIYKIIGGGQRVRQNVELGIAIKYQVDENSDYVEKSGCNGSDSFTGAMWSTNFEDLQKWANAWAGTTVELIEDND